MVLCQDKRVRIVIMWFWLPHTLCRGTAIFSCGAAAKSKEIIFKRSGNFYFTSKKIYGQRNLRTLCVLFFKKTLELGMGSPCVHETSFDIWKKCCRYLSVPCVIREGRIYGFACIGIAWKSGAGKLTMTTARNTARWVYNRSCRSLTCRRSFVAIPVISSPSRFCHLQSSQSINHTACRLPFFMWQ